jgi:hypothetical protein
MASFLLSGSITVSVLPRTESTGLHLLKANLHESLAVFYNHRPDSGFPQYHEQSPAMPVQPRATLFSSVHSCQTTRCRILDETGNLPLKIGLLINT